MSLRYDPQIMLHTQATVYCLIFSAVIVTLKQLCQALESDDCAEDSVVAILRCNTVKRLTHGLSPKVQSEKSNDTEKSRRTHVYIPTLTVTLAKPQSCLFRLFALLNSHKNTSSLVVCGI